MFAGLVIRLHYLKSDKLGKDFNNFLTVENATGIETRTAALSLLRGALTELYGLQEGLTENPDDVRRNGLSLERVEEDIQKVTTAVEYLQHLAPNVITGIMNAYRPVFNNFLQFLKTGELVPLKTHEELIVEPFDPRQYYGIDEIRKNENPENYDTEVKNTYEEMEKEE